jgi:hypothetical protein
MTKFRITVKTLTIDLNDPENEVILKAKERADGIMEWAKMFHQAHIVFLLASLILAFTALDRAYWVSMSMFIVCFIISLILQHIAKTHLKNTVMRNMPND